MKMIVLAILPNNKNIIVNNSTLKGDSYFIVANSKTQEVDQVSNDN